MEPIEEYNTPLSIWYRVARLLPAFVAVLSVMAVPNGLTTTNYVELVLSGLGVVGAVVYYINRRRHRSIELALTLFWVWTLLQLPGLLLVTPQGYQPLWDTSDFIGLRFNMGFHTNAGNSLQVGFNLLPIVYFI